MQHRLVPYRTFDLLVAERGPEVRSRDEVDQEQIDMLYPFLMSAQGRSPIRLLRVALSRRPEDQELLSFEQLAHHISDHEATPEQWEAAAVVGELREPLETASRGV